MHLASVFFHRNLVLITVSIKDNCIIASPKQSAGLWRMLKDMEDNDMKVFWVPELIRGAV